MNKKLMVLLLAAIMLLAAGCKKDADTRETTAPSQNLESETNPAVSEETISGVEILDEPLNSPFDEMENAEQEATDNNSSTDNTGNSDGSNSGDSNTEKPDQSGNDTPAESKPAESKPTEPGATEPEGGIRYVSYEEYNNMTPAEQVAYYNQFPSVEAFVQWYNEAKAEYDKEHGAIDVGDGDIDLGDIINP